MIFKMQKLFSKKIFMLILACSITFCMQGCSMPEKLSDTSIVFTGGLTNNEIFKIEDSICYSDEFYVYMINMQKEYENMLSGDITSIDGMDTKIKNACVSKLARIKTMVLLANEKGISLSDEENEKVETAAKEYYDSLSESDIEAINGASLTTIEKLYKERALAAKLYEYTIKDISPEVSDDEARTITLRQIVLKTYTTNADGEKTKMSSEEKEAQYELAKAILKKINDGEDFEVLATTYNEAEEQIISFGKGEVDENLENAAFNLATDEVSGIIETDEGYIILKCITTFDKEETAANKERIIELRKSEAFGEEYDDFASSLTTILNEDLLGKIELTTDTDVTTHTFFDVYDEYFGE